VTAKSKAESALLATTVVWGGTFAIVKLGMQDVSPILLIAIRFTIAGFLYAALFWRRIFPLTAAAILKGTILSLFLFAGFVSQNIGLTITTASKSAFITSMMVIFVPVLQFVIERKAPRVGNILGIVVVCTGLWFLTSPAGSAFNAGDALTLVCAILFAFYIVYLDVVSREMSPLQVTFLQMGIIAVLSTVSVILFETPRFALTGQSILTLLYLTFLATALTTYVQSRFQKDTTPTRAVVIFSIEPVFAAAIAYILLGEQLGNMGILGGALIIGGVLLSEISDSIPILNRSLDPTES
jgi:drug/metabolite transporter (DMT)-like permease